MNMTDVRNTMTQFNTVHKNSKKCEGGISMSLKSCQVIKLSSQSLDDR